MKILVGLVGKKQSGKDTSGEILARLMLSAHGFKPYRVSFADSVKEEIAAATGGSVDVINRNKHLPEVRKLLQWWGTDLRRAQDKFYWIWKAKEKIQAAPDGSFVYVTDCRFTNEAALITELHGRVIKVDRPRLSSDDTHISETELERITPTWHLENNGSMADLTRNCKWIAGYLAEQYGL